MFLEMPSRTAWGDFPDVVIHAAESVVKQHPAYGAAKAGESDAAARRYAEEHLYKDAVQGRFEARLLKLKRM